MHSFLPILKCVLMFLERILAIRKQIIAKFIASYQFFFKNDALRDLTATQETMVGHTAM